MGRGMDTVGRIGQGGRVGRGGLTRRGRRRFFLQARFSGAASSHQKALLSPIGLRALVIMAAIASGNDCIRYGANSDL